MKIVDQLFGWVLVAVGIISCAFTFRAYGFSSISIYSYSILVVVAGLVNVVRAGASSGLLRFTSAFSNIFVLAVGVVHAWSLKAVLRQNPQAPVLVIAAAIEVIFAIWG